ncbi:MAG: hypothetical protein ACREOK_13800, partial [Gemmatimonadaceae bacterium]
LATALFPWRDAFAQKFPEKWDQGLVIGQIINTTPYGLITDIEDFTRISVGRRDADGGVSYGLVAFKAKEGMHELKSIYNARVVIPINRKFEARKGHITILGLMALMPNPENREQFRVVQFDNADETLEFVKRTHPQLLAGHEDATILPGPGPYLSRERLVAVRTNVARIEARKSKKQGRFWVAGMAGTIAEVDVAGDSIRVLRFLPPMTYQEPLISKWDDAGTLSFGTYDRFWRVVDGKVEAAPAPKVGR